MSEVLVTRPDEHVELWTLHRPAARNALDRAALRALQGCCARIEQDAATTRVVLITGAGGRAFSAGADLKERKAMSPDEVPAAVALIRATFDRVARLPIPVIAAIDGFALGGGLELALACDLRAVGTGASLGLTETRLAIIPGAGGTQRLPRLIGIGRARELIYTGRRVDAAEALALGLAELDGRGGGALDAALQTARAIAAGGPVAVRAAKDAIDRGTQGDLGFGLQVEQECYARTVPTSDRLEALAAFAERRVPRFEGR